MKHCTLCGGKLNSEKRCTFCGLDNTKNDDMYKRMVNRNSCANEPLTHVHEEPSPKRVQSRPQPIKSSASIQKQESGTYKKAAKSKKKASGCVTFIGLIPFIIAIIGFLGSVASDIFSEMSGIIPEPDFFIEEDLEFNDNYDPYEWVVDEMPEEGEFFETILQPGIYEVGCHIPMGTYEITPIAGTYSSVEIYDEWNEIYISEFLNGNADDSFMTDVLLFNGAYLLVLPGSEISLHTKNAQQIATEGVQNLPQEVIVLNGELVAEEDFESGLYNIIYEPALDEYSYLDITITTDVSDYSFQITFDDTMGDEIFYNVPLPEGAIIEVDETQLEGVEQLFMIPSEMTSVNVLENFYYAY